MTWYIKVLQKYAVFDGRVRRKEYWYFQSFSVIIALVLAVIDVETGIYSVEIGGGLLWGTYALAVLIPTLAVSVRRLHGTGRSGWWLLVAPIPVIGGIVLLVFFWKTAIHARTSTAITPRRQLLANRRRGIWRKRRDRRLPAYGS